jgi:hypothetical protein
MPNFDFATRLADIAVETDELNKSMLSLRELHQIELCRDVMHTTAQMLAGDRIGKLYGDDTGLDELREWRRNRIAGTQAAGLPRYLTESRAA